MQKLKNFTGKKILIGDNLKTRFSLIFCLMKNYCFTSFSLFLTIFKKNHLFYQNFVKTKFEGIDTRN